MDTPSSTATAVATLAALYTRLRTRWSPQMQAVCDRYDESMRSHYEWLSQQVVQFQQDKAVLLGVLQKEDSHALLPPPQAFGADAVVGGMMPESLQRLLALLKTGHEPMEEDQQQAGRDNAAPQRPPSGGRPDNSTQRTMASYFANKAVSPTETYFAQLLRSQSSNTTNDGPGSKKPRLAPSSPPIYTWEVEATDYVFQYAPFGPGWFVLRCTRGMDLPAVVFDVDPLCDRGRALGLAHFNDGICKYHEKKAYTEAEMMVAYARRVVDDGDEDVTAQWAAESNEHIIEMTERREKKRMRRKQTRKSIKVERMEQGEGGIGRLASLMCGSTVTNPVALSDDDEFVVLCSEDDSGSFRSESSIGEY